MGNVLVVGTGTIGMPLIGLLARHREQLGIDKVLFNKNTPLQSDAPQVRELLGIGAKLVADSEKFEAFSALGLPPFCSRKDALKAASVVIDCTPRGNDNKAEVYEYLDGPRGFIAQGSEKGFGTPYALGINDGVLESGRFVQVVSCNTHNIAALVAALGFEGGVPNGGRPTIERATFVCMRRADDVSQDGSFIASPEVGKHSDERFGTHHARDAHDLFGTLGHDLPLWSSAVKLNTQYMHSMWFSVELDHAVSKGEALSRLSSAPYVAMTTKRSTNKVFSFGRDHGYYGRILNQAVVASDTIAVNGCAVTGFCFTPQDGNSLLSSVAATLRFLHGDVRRLSCLNKYLFKEV